MLTIEEAATILEEKTPELRALKNLIELAKATAERYFDAHPDLSDYDGRIGIKRGSQTRLDTSRVKVELGARLADFQYSVPVVEITLVHRAARGSASENTHSHKPAPSASAGAGEPEKAR